LSRRVGRLGGLATGALLAAVFLAGCTSVRVPVAETANPTSEPSVAAAELPPEPRSVRPDSSGDAARTAEVFPEAMFDAPDVDPVLDARIRSIIDAPPHHQTHWGIVARDMHDGQLLYQLNAHRMFIPASNMKVLVAAAALAELGAEFRYSTVLWATGPVRSGTLSGALVLDGRGDPTLSDRFRESWRSALDELADLVVRTGITRVRGPLIIDASRWDSTSVEGSWMVEDVGWPWAASGGAFVVADGEVTATVYGGPAVGEPAAVEWSPDLGSERLASDVMTWALDSTALRPGYREGNRQLVLGGSIGVNLRKRERLAARDPVRIAGELLLDALRSRGVRVDGGVEFVWEPGEPLGECLGGGIETCRGATRVARLESPPLIQIVKALLEPSQNWIAEQLVRTLGAERGERGSWAEGLRVVEEVLTREYAVLSSDLDLNDGSGLSAYNLVTPRALAGILFKARILEFGEQFKEALASPGEAGSTLSGRLELLEGRLFAKTGTLTHTNSLSGYLTRDNGREMVFSILSNGSRLEARDVRDAIDRLVLELSRL